VRRKISVSSVTLAVALGFSIPLCQSALAQGAEGEKAKAAKAPPGKAMTYSVVAEETLDISPVWAGHPVGFALLTKGDRQFVAFYDAERRLTVAARRLNEKTWKMVRLPETTGWDSHNYIAMTADDDGYLHLSGNMHVVPLIYFRTTKPWDIDSFEKVPSMVGDKETKTTYPIFFRGPSNELLFTYRDGSSGDGDQIYNVYDRKTRTWKRLLDKPFTNGEGQRNAYLSSPQRGPDGFFHIVWVWRETPDASTNHDPSYARSKDLVHWEDSAGKPLPLPITLQSGDIVDHVPEKGGVINGNVRLGFDAQKRVIVSYHKYDANGKTQLYSARREKDGWKVYQTTDWDYRWDFGGGGSIPFEVGLGAVTLEPDGRLSQSYRHSKYGSGTWYLDPDTLKPTGTKPAIPSYPAELQKAQGSFPALEVRWAGDSGESGEKNVRYTLRWETLGSNRDKARPGPLPEPTMLRLYKIRTTEK
jgi:hypothetical protein